ncbi:MAG: hypothetical protein RLZZ624_1311 [Cyanobacteriota bacterium]|jgi:nitroreductase
MTGSPAELLASLQWRYATKAFDRTRTIDPNTWQALETSLVLTPSSYGLQPWRFLVLQDPELRSRLRPHAWNQAQITDCSHLLVLLVRRTIEGRDLDRLIERMAALRQTAPERLQAYRQMMAADLIDGPRSQRIDSWATNQVYIALGGFMTAAALLGVDTCAIEGFSPPEFDRLLDLESSDYRSAVVCAAGYRDPADPYAKETKVRYDASELIDRC